MAPRRHASKPPREKATKENFDFVMGQKNSSGSSSKPDNLQESSKESKAKKRLPVNNDTKPFAKIFSGTHREETPQRSPSTSTSSPRSRLPGLLSNGELDPNFTITDMVDLLIPNPLARLYGDSRINGDHLSPNLSTSHSSSTSDSTSSPSLPQTPVDNLISEDKSELSEDEIKPSKDLVQLSEDGDELSEDEDELSEDEDELSENEDALSELYPASTSIVNPANIGECPMPHTNDDNDDDDDSERSGSISRHPSKISSQLGLIEPIPPICSPDSKISLIKPSPTDLPIKPPVVSFYVPRLNVPPKTLNASKSSIKPHERIMKKGTSKMFSSVLSDDDIHKLKRLQYVWQSIRKLTDFADWQRLSSLHQPILMNLKIVEFRRGYMELVDRASSFDSCAALFDVLGNISTSKFEYHKAEVFKEVATPMFMSTLQYVVDQCFENRPVENELVRFIENLVDIYGDIFLQLDRLATDGLACDLEKIIQRCLLLFKNEDGDQSYCSEQLDQLLLIISSRDSLIRANSCYPFDILKEESVESNVIDGPFENFDQYLSIHYRLLKEDFQNSLRVGITNYLTTLFGGRKRRTINYHLNVFPKVTLKCYLTPLTVKYQIFFHDPVIIAKLQDPNSKSFLTGSLLILTSTSFQDYYLAKVEDSSPLEREKSHIFVSLILPPPNITRNLDLLMVEPCQLFEPYFRVLNVIRSLDVNHFPFTRYIVDVNTDVSPPSYMTTSTKLNVGNFNVSLWEDGTWPKPEEIGLNLLQLQGLKQALRSELAIIQGPPGTGKTYLSKKIIEVLLQNKKLWHKGPDAGACVIMVVCYKNQSLDQLLSGLINSGVKVLRVGTQSKEERLDSYNLKNLESPKFSKIYFQMKAMLSTERKELMDEFNESMGIVRTIEDYNGLMKLEVISTVLRLSVENNLYLESNMENWLVELHSSSPDFCQVNLILAEKINWAEEDANEEMSPFQCSTLQDVKNLLFKVNATLDDLEESCDSRHIDVLTSAAVYLVDKLTFMEDRLNELKQLLSPPQQKEMFQLKMEFESEQQPHLNTLPLKKRWLLYKAWLNDLFQFHLNQISSMAQMSQDQFQRYIELEELITLRKVAQCDAEVVGMTTTAAAKYHKMVECLKPKILLVEEAAEVVEAHTIASISRYCEHLILVGDHKQLRPLTSSHLIGKEAHLDISLYERLVRNGFPHCTLNIQYRMRPEIAALIAPAVYSDLVNSPTVQELPHVLGVAGDLYFVDHSINEDETPDVLSRWNKHEAEFLLALCDYLVKQGYKPSQITILATYSEQEKYFNKEKANYPELEDVLMATVDSFQGKENDIILLSIVRSNPEGIIGFLAQKNRINVALSRAKRGLYITGNSKILVNKGGLWGEVVEELKRFRAIGRSLPLKCEIHGKLTHVANARDIKLLKNGGCTRQCGMKLACQHKCIQLCHPADRNHENTFKCSTVCNKAMKCNHHCILKCHFGIDSLKCFCASCTPKTQCGALLPCGHRCERIAHAEDIEHKTDFQCQELCNTVLQCGHTCSSLCHVEDSEHKKRYKCPIVCDGSLFCKHPCTLKTFRKHVCSDHKNPCSRQCKTKMECEHVCKRTCHNVDRNHHGEYQCLECLKNIPDSVVIDPQVNISSDPNSSKQSMFGNFSKGIQKVVCEKNSETNTESTNRTSEKSPSETGESIICSDSNKSNDVNMICFHDRLILTCKEICQGLRCGHKCQASLKKNRHRCLDHRFNFKEKLCGRKCNSLLPCAHKCSRKCHSDAEAAHTCKKKCKSAEPLRTILSLKEPYPVVEKMSTTTSSSSIPDVNIVMQPAGICDKRCGFQFICGHLCEKLYGHGTNGHCKPCKRQCGATLACGHLCTNLCHIKSNPHTLTDRCKTCENAKHEPMSSSDNTGIDDDNLTLESKPTVDNSVVTTTATPKTCPHGKPWGLDCSGKCHFEYDCGHLRGKNCQHANDNRHTVPCKSVCGANLVCGHACLKACHTKTNPHTPSDCCKSCKKTQAILQVLTGKLGKNNSGIITTATPKKCTHGQPWGSDCSDKCHFEYDCGHLCGKKCQHANDKGHTKPCKRVCGATLFCAHVCIQQCHFHSDPHALSDCCKSCENAKHGSQSSSERDDTTTTIDDLPLPLESRATEVITTSTPEKCSHGNPWGSDCSNKCHFEYDCGHLCGKKCQHANDNGHTKPCKRVCGANLVCAHICSLQCHFHSDPHAFSDCCKTCENAIHESPSSSEREDTKTTIDDLPLPLESRPTEIITTATPEKCSHGNPWGSDCSNKCHFEYDCGHLCGKKCQHANDNGHTKPCKRVCGANLVCAHICSLQCHFHSDPHAFSDCCKTCENAKHESPSSSERDDTTTTIDDLPLPLESRPTEIITTATPEKCSHGNPWGSDCSNKCHFEYDCGHLCGKKCQHANDNGHTKPCKRVCGANLVCAHICSLQCHFHSDPHAFSDCCKTCENAIHESPSSSECEDTKTTIDDLPLPLESRPTEIITTATPEKCSHGNPWGSDCSNKCHFEYDCGHLCGKKCQHANDNGHTKPCKRVCGANLVCAHICSLQCHFHSDPHALSDCCKTCENAKHESPSSSERDDTTTTIDDLPLPLESRATEVITTATPEKCSHGKPWGSDCNDRCNFKYDCGHLCGIKCQHVADGGHDKVCRRLCGTHLSCGHLCCLPCHLKPPARSEFFETLPCFCVYVCHDDLVGTTSRT